jgi:hypothetical protein
MSKLCWLQAPQIPTRKFTIQAPLSRRSTDLDLNPLKLRSFWPAGYPTCRDLTEAASPQRSSSENAVQRI